MSHIDWSAEVPFAVTVCDQDGIILDMEHTVTGRQRVVGPPVLLSASPTGNPLPAPALGEHTAAILAGLGMTSAEIEALEAANVVRTLA